MIVGIYCKLYGKAIGSHKSKYWHHLYHCGKIWKKRELPSFVHSICLSQTNGHLQSREGFEAHRKDRLPHNQRDDTGNTGINNTSMRKGPEASPGCRGPEAVLAASLTSLNSQVLCIWKLKVKQLSSLIGKQANGCHCCIAETEPGLRGDLQQLHTPAFHFREQTTLWMQVSKRRQ